MSFKAFFVKQVLIPFFIITTCVSIAEGILGMIFYPDIEISYYALFSPAIFGVLTSLPSLVMYSKKELSARQVIVRNVIQIVLIEITVLLLNFFCGNILSIFVAISLMVTVLIIFAAVMSIEYLNEKRIADELNAALKKMNG